jgi:membrane-bound lytic murein transglycosylase F
MNIKKLFSYFLLLSVLLLGSFGCSNNKGFVLPLDLKSRKIDLTEIVKRGKLTVLAENSSTSFFSYRGKKMGFEYEMLKEFAKYLGVRLEVKIVQNLDNLIDLLNKGEGDVIACNYPVTLSRKKRIHFSIPYLQTPMVLVQRKHLGNKPILSSNGLIRDPNYLAHTQVTVWKNSNHYNRLVNLQDEIADYIAIRKVDGNIGCEELIEMVSENEIDYTVAEENSAKVNCQFFDNLDIKTILSVNQKIAFGLRKNSHLLKKRMDFWLSNYIWSADFKNLKKKYFDVEHAIVKAAVYSKDLKFGKLSPYDQIFKRVAAKYHWDWRLLASLAYNESRFNPNVRGLGGAYGIMQFMPGIGSRYGVHPSSSVANQILGGMQKLNADFEAWSEIPDKIQRRKFTLATYNAGKSHVEDAQRLAKKYGLNPLVWDDNVEIMIINLSKSKYYRDEVVKNGALRGHRTYNYVRVIYDRYLEWCTIYN